MMRSLTDLVTTIETELHIGEQLLHNLAAQKAAILNWNATKLLEGLSEKELLLHRLQVATARQNELLAHNEGGSQEVPLRLLEFVAQLPTGPEKSAILQLQLRVCDLYTTLQTEEQKLVSLLENMLGHTQEILHAFEPSSIALYGRSGTTSVSHPEPELLQEKA